MFSGIIQGKGKVLKITTKKDHISFEISFPKNFSINLKKCEHFSKWCVFDFIRQW